MACSVSKERRNEYGKVFRTKSAFREDEFMGKRFFVDLTKEIS